MITAPQLYALGGEASKSLRRIARWTRFLGVVGFIMLALASVACVALLFIEGVPKLMFAILFVTILAGAVPSYFMLTTARAFRAIPQRAVLTHFDRPFTELRRLFFWFIGVIGFNVVLGLTFVVASLMNPSFALSLAGVGSPEAQTKNVARIRAVAGAIDAYAKAHGAYPATLSDVESVAVPVVDEWQRPFVYTTEQHGGVVDGYTLASLGANGTSDELVARIEGSKPTKPKDLDTRIANGIFTLAPDLALIGKRAAE